MIEHQARMGQDVARVARGQGWRIVNSTPLPVVCFTRDGLVPGELLAALRERQIAWMSEAQLGGVPVMRACITSFKTTEQDVEWVVDEMNGLCLRLSGARPRDTHELAQSAITEGWSYEAGNDRNPRRLRG